MGTVGRVKGERNPIVEKAINGRGKPYWRCRVWLKDGSLSPRISIPVERRFRRDACVEHAKAKQEEEDRTGFLYKAKLEGQRATDPTGKIAADGTESIRGWFKRFYDKCEASGQRAVRTRRGMFKEHLDRDGFGDLSMTAPTPVLREAIRKRVTYLDEKIALRDAFYRDEVPWTSGRKPGLSPKTAQNIWSELAGGFYEACTSKDRSLKVRGDDDDPTEKVQPPNKGEDRDQAALYPSEILLLLSCEDVPLYRRELYAIALYTGIRQGECRGLMAGDVDFEHGVINVRRQLKKKTGAGRTKTRAGVRQIPIHPNIEKLLEMLIARANVDHVKRKQIDPDAKPGPLVHVPPMEDCAALLRDVDLPKAGCTRAELFLDNDTQQHFTFHGLRHTCITHWAVSGMNYSTLMAAAGHTDKETTERYIDQGLILRSQRFGEPHPPIPEGLLRSTSRSKEAGAPPKRVPGKSKRAGTLTVPAPVLTSLLATPAGIEPALPA